MSRLGIAILVFGLVVALADVFGVGHGFNGVALLLLVFFIATALLTHRGWRIVFSSMLALSVGMAMIAVEQQWFMTRSRGIFASANFLGGYAVLHFFIALHIRPQMRRNWPIDLAMVANLVSLGLAQSRGAIAAFGIGLAVLLWQKRPYLVLIPLPPALAAIIYLGLSRPDALSDPRFGIWRAGWAGFKERPLLGWGQHALYNTFYNSALDWMIAAGILGLGAGIWVMIEAARAARAKPYPWDRRTLLAFLAAWTANSMVMFDTAATTLPLFAILAYLASEYRDVTDATCFIDDKEIFFRSGLSTGRQVADRTTHSADGVKG
jgi:O-antigen ligase